MTLSKKYCYDAQGKFWYLKISDFKEFIKKLKKKFQEGCYSYLGTKSEVMGLNCDGKHWLCSACETKLREIDKLAGDELNERI